MMITKCNIYFEICLCKHVGFNQVTVTILTWLLCKWGLVFKLYVQTIIYAIMQLSGNYCTFNKGFCLMMYFLWGSSTSVLLCLSVLFSCKLVITLGWVTAHTLPYIRIYNCSLYGVVYLAVVLGV